MAQKGVVKWFNDVKGFGFIEPEGGGEDIFAHYSAIQMEGFRTLRQGSKVRFDVVDGPKGKLAQNICTDTDDTDSVPSPNHLIPPGHPGPTTSMLDQHSRLAST